MAKLPKEIKLTRHAKLRLKERKNSNSYNTKNLMRSSCKWYGKDDLIVNSALYLHCLYVCRKSNQMGYITDGNIEVLYNRGTGVAITIMEVKEKFLPITQYIKPEYLEQIKIKKEKKKMEKLKLNQEANVCPDCGKENMELTSLGVCARCRARKFNAEHRNRVYVPYINLSEKEKTRIDHMQIASAKAHKIRKEKRQQLSEMKEIPMPKISVAENYYEVKATQNPAIAHIAEETEPVHKSSVQSIDFNSQVDQKRFIDILKEYNCTIPDEKLKNVLDILVATDKIKNVFLAALKDENKEIILGLESILDDSEKKLQYNWESNGFQNADDLKFKEFLTWRKILKESMSFWDKLYQTNNVVSEMKKTLNVVSEDIITKEDKEDNKENKEETTTQKKFQITTESISTIFNTRRPFTRVFYATSKEEAYNEFSKWMSERQLHENKSKTNIVELTQEGENDEKTKQ